MNEAFAQEIQKCITIITKPIARMKMKWKSKVVSVVPPYRERERDRDREREIQFSLRAIMLHHPSSVQSKMYHITNLTG